MKKYMVFAKIPEAEKTVFLIFCFKTNKRIREQILQQRLMQKIEQFHHRLIHWDEMSEPDPL